MAYISKKKLPDNSIAPIGSNLFGTCSTASATAAKVVSMPDFDVLIEGVTIHVYFTHKNTASSATLKVGSTSAVSIKHNGQLGGSWDDGAFISFTYYQNAWHQNDITIDGVTYTFTISGHTMTISGSDGSTQTVTLPDDNTTYALSKSGDQITLTGSDGSTSSVTDSGGMTKAQILDMFFPVGTQYMTTDGNFNPMTDWGGTWSLLGEGKVLMSGSANGTYQVGNEYGENEKPIQVTNLPSHNHPMAHTHGMGHSHPMPHTHGTGSSDASYKYFLTATGIPSYDDSNALSGSGWRFLRVNSSGAFGYREATSQPSNADTSATAKTATDGASTPDTGNKGDGTNFNVMQKSKAVYVWERTG